MQERYNNHTICITGEIKESSEFTGPVDTNARYQSKYLFLSTDCVRKKTLNVPKRVRPLSVISLSHSS